MNNSSRYRTCSRYRIVTSILSLVATLGIVGSASAVAADAAPITTNRTLSGKGDKKGTVGRQPKNNASQVPCLKALATSSSFDSERVGFEPTDQAYNPITDLANRRFQPLSHLSNANAPEGIGECAILKRKPPRNQVQSADSAGSPSPTRPGRPTSRGVVQGLVRIGPAAASSRRLTPASPRCPGPCRCWPGLPDRPGCNSCSRRRPAARWPGRGPGWRIPALRAGPCGSGRDT